MEWLRNLSSDARHVDLIPDQGTKIPHGMGQLSSPTAMEGRKGVRKEQKEGKKEKGIKKEGKEGWKRGIKEGRPLYPGKVQLQNTEKNEEIFYPYLTFGWMKGNITCFLFLSYFVYCFVLLKAL